VRSADDTTIGRQTAEQQRRCVQVTQQNLQGRLIKAGMHRLQNEVIVFILLGWICSTNDFPIAYGLTQ
jgi:hypothetical protein